MPSGVAARRYAQAVFEMADERGALDQWERDLGRLADALGDPAIAAFFASPKTPTAEKLATARRILGPDAQPLVANLTGLLIERGRFGLLPALYAAFHDMVLARRGIAVADVTTAVPLDAQERAIVQQRLRQVVGKDIELRTAVDPGIIGGIIARVGDQLIDGSVTSQLRRLRDQLVTAR
jgi:F-type H+-transporting ATPase subunit delta